MTLKLGAKVFLVLMIGSLFQPETLAARAKLPPASKKARARSWDWSRTVGAGTVRNQGKTNNCWAFAAIEALESNWALRNRTRPQLAVQPVLDRTKSAGPDWTATAFDALIKHGTALERNYPWVGSPRPLRRVVAPYRAARWGYVVSGGKKPTIAQLKRALITRGPLTVGVYRTPAFQAYRGGVFRVVGRTLGPERIDHYVVLVGWDDAKGAWKIKNSWGENWGEKGFAWVAYGCNNIGAQAAWVEARAVR